MAGHHPPDRPDRAGLASERAAAPSEPGEPAARSPLSVERLTHQDIPAVCSLYKRVWDSEKPDLPADTIKAWVPTPLEFTSWMEGVTYFAARREGKLIGAAGLQIVHGSGEIVHLAVDPEARRTGVGAALTHATLEWARHSGCPSVWASALARFTAVAGLLKRLGFAESGALHRHEWGQDVRLFERVL